MDLSSLKVLLVSYTHKVGGKTTYMAGPPQDCAHYLRERAAKLTFIEQPSPISSDVTLTATVWTRGAAPSVIRWAWPSPPITEGRNLEERAPVTFLAFKIRELLGTLYLLTRTRDRYDLYIGVEAPNAVTGVCLRWLGWVRRVVYDVIDYSPRRFASPTLNQFFHWLDGWCVRHVDVCWSQTSGVACGRLVVPIQG